MNRKEFVKTTGLAAATVALLPSKKLFAKTADTKVKVAALVIKNYYFIQMKY